MNILDIVIIVPLLWAAYRGFNKGLIIEVSTLIALGLGIWGGVHLSHYIVNLLTDKIDDKYINLVAFSCTFLVIVIAVYVVGKALEKIVNLIQLKLLNKLGGAAFGIAKVALICSVLLVIINGYSDTFSIIPEDQKQNSVLFEPMSGLAVKIIPAMQESKFVPSPVAL